MTAPRWIIPRVGSRWAGPDRHELGAFTVLDVDLFYAYVRNEASGLPSYLRESRVHLSHFGTRYTELPIA